MDNPWMLPGADTKQSCMSQATGFQWRDIARGTVTCQVDGCTADLTQEEKAYCLKKRICSYHMRAEVIMRPGDTDMHRFCFQCGRLEPLSQFDGAKRSCRARLERRKLPPRRSQTWTAGCAPRTFGTSTAALKQQSAQQQHQQQHMLLLELQQQQQQLQLEKQLLQQQQQQQQLRMQEASAAVSVDSSAAAAAAAVPGSVSPEAMALWQQDQVLAQQKMQMEALQASVANISAQLLALSPQTPATVTPGRVCYPGCDAVGSGQTSPAARLNGMASQEYATPVLASVGGFHPSFALGQQQQAQLQLQGRAVGAAPSTAAAAAAALAGSSSWPYSGSAQGHTAASTGVGVQTQAKTSRSKSSRAPLSGASILEEGGELFDEINPLADDDNIHTAVADALNAEFAAAFPGLDLAEESGSAQLQQNTQAMLQQQHLSTAMAPVVSAGSGVHHFLAETPAPVLQQNGFMQAIGTSARGLGFGAPAPALQQPQGGPQLVVYNWHQQQLQQLLQTVNVLQHHVKELSLHMHGAPAAPSATAASTGSFGGQPSM